MYKKTPSSLKVGWIVCIVLSVIVRIPSLDNLSQEWRPLQTEMTAYWFLREGIDLINYQTPLYGPPLNIPFEFPLFQAMSAAISKAGFGSLGFASRVTALLCFYLSAWFLYLLCKKIFADHQMSFAIITLYLWLPYNVHYSTQPLIDYLALAMALAYLFFILCWLNTRTLDSALGATICGSLGILIKPTTTPIVVIPILAFITRDFISSYRQDFTRPINLRFVLSQIWVKRSYWFTLIFMAVIPIGMGSAWTYHSDLLKQTSVFTQWLTSKSLVAWNFGTWELRTNQDIWIDYSSAVEKYLLPYGLSIFVTVGVFNVLGIINSPREKAEIRLFITSIIASVVVVFVTFLNLYRHEYYYIALSASTAILAGYGMARFLQLKQHILTFIFTIWVMVFIVLNLKDVRRFHDVAVYNNQKAEQSIDWAHDVQQFVPPDKWVVVVEYAWNPAYVYPLQRKTMVVSPRELGKSKSLCRMLSDERFTLVVVGDLAYDQNENLLKYTFKCFRSKKEVRPGIYLVTH